MSKFLEAGKKVRPYMIMLFVFFSLLRAFSPENVTYPLVLQLSHIGVVVFGIPHFVSLFQQKNKPLFEYLFIIALAASVIFYWI